METEKNIKTHKSAVDFYLFDFRPTFLTSKLRKSESARKVFTDFDLAEMMANINNEFGEYIELHLSLRNIIDAQFIKTKTYFNVAFAIFAIGFILPFLLQLFLFKFGSGMIICNSVCLLTIAFSFGVGVAQHKANGLKAYFKDFSNKVESSMLIIYCIYFVIRIINDSSILPADLDADDQHLAQLIALVIFNAILVLQAILKVMLYMRTSNYFGQLIALLAQCCSDVLPFMFLLFIWVFVFDIWYRILGLQIGSTSAPYLNSIVRYGI